MLNRDLLNRAASKDISAMIEVANAYYLGEGVETDDNKAFAMFNEIVSLDPSQADVYTDIGTCWFYGYGTTIDQETGLKYWEKARSMGSAGAFMRFGLVYRDGEAVEKNPQLAVQFFEKAIELGNTRSMVELGDMYYYGDGIPKDAAKAVSLFEKAAQDGHINGQHKLAIAYRDGEGVPAKDDEKALYWFEKAAEQGGERSMVLAGIICQERGNLDQAKVFFAQAMEADTADGAYFHGLICGAQGDMPAAFNSFKKGYELGDANSAYRLGNCYMRGEGTGENTQLAIESYEYAANHGVGDASFMLATIYRDGKGVPQDPNKQFVYMKKACDANVPVACFFLAECYHDGIGVEPNPEKELECLEKGVLIGNNELKTACAAATGERYFNGNGVPKDIDKAMEYWHIAAELGHVGSMMALGQIYENVDGRTNTAKALQYYTAASEQGVARAYVKLGIFANDGIGMPSDKAKAIQYFIHARDLGDTDVENLIVFVLSCNDFENFDIDIKTEIEHAKPLAENGDAEAAFAVYRLMLKDPDSNIDECNVWERLAVKGGHPKALEVYAGMWAADVIETLDPEIYIEGCTVAQKNGEQFVPVMHYVLGQSYLTAQGGNRNIQLAEKHIKLAADNGYALAMRVLGNEYDDDGAFRTDHSASMHYYKMAIDANEDQYALFFLARHYLSQNDGTTAAAYLRRAANGSNKDIADKSREVLEEIERVDRENVRRQHPSQPVAPPKPSSSFKWVLCFGCVIAIIIAIILFGNQKENPEAVNTNDAPSISFDVNTQLGKNATHEEIGAAYALAFARADDVNQYAYRDTIYNSNYEIEGIDRIIISAFSDIEAYIGIDGTMIDGYWFPLLFGIDVYNPTSDQIEDITTLYADTFNIVFGTDWEVVKNQTYAELINWDLENDYRGYTEYIFDNNIAAYSESFLGDGEMILTINGYEDTEPK